jgi:hypothetical protein
MNEIIERCAICNSAEERIAAERLDPITLTWPLLRFKETPGLYTSEEMRDSVERFRVWARTEAKRRQKDGERWCA